MIEKIKKIWKIRDLRNNIILSYDIVFRLFAHIPVPGVNVALEKFYLIRF